MGRTSDLVKGINTNIVIAKHVPDPPSELSYPQSEIWVDLFSVIDDGWITPAQYALASAYCRHCDAANRVSKLIDMHNRHMDQFDNFNTDDVKTLDRLLKIQEREVRSLSSVLSRLRLTNINIRSDKSKNPSPIVNSVPWELTEDLATDRDTHDDES